jgi:hypothetical protein
MTGYVNALKLRLEDQDTRDEVFADLEKVQYTGCIRDMFTKIQMYNDKALVIGVRGSPLTAIIVLALAI